MEQVLDDAKWVLALGKDELEILWEDGEGRKDGCDEEGSNKEGSDEEESEEEGSDKEESDEGGSDKEESKEEGQDSNEKVGTNWEYKGGVSK